MIVVIGSDVVFVILCEVFILIGGAEKKHEKYPVKIVGVPPEVQTGHILNTSPDFMLEPVHS
jgi:hypothetical protein